MWCSEVGHPEFTVIGHHAMIRFAVSVAAHSAATHQKSKHLRRTIPTSGKQDQLDPMLVGDMKQR